MYNFSNFMIIPPLVADHIWVAAGIFTGCIVVISTVADRRRARRADIDAVGFMPWTLITVMAVLATVICAALALKSG